MNDLISLARAELLDANRSALARAHNVLLGCDVQASRAMLVVTESGDPLGQKLIAMARRNHAKSFVVGDSAGAVVGIVRTTDVVAFLEREDHRIIAARLTVTPPVAAYWVVAIADGGTMLDIFSRDADLASGVIRKLQVITRGSDS